jgi:hypothetical protein
MHHPWFFYSAVIVSSVLLGGDVLYPFVSGDIFAGICGGNLTEQPGGKYRCNRLDHASNADIHEKPSGTTYNLFLLKGEFSYFRPCKKTEVIE